MIISTCQSRLQQMLAATAALLSSNAWQALFVFLYLHLVSDSYQSTIQTNQAQLRGAPVLCRHKQLLQM